MPPSLRLSAAAIVAAVLAAALAPGIAAAQCDPTAPDCFDSSAEPPAVMIGDALPPGEQQVELRVYYSDDHWLDAQSVQVTVTGGTITSNTFSPESGDRAPPRHGWRG